MTKTSIATVVLLAAILVACSSNKPAQNPGTELAGTWTISAAETGATSSSCVQLPSFLFRCHWTFIFFPFAFSVACCAIVFCDAVPATTSGNLAIKSLLGSVVVSVLLSGL
jgi:hypothetical protein